MKVLTILEQKVNMLLMGDFNFGNIKRLEDDRVSEMTQKEPDQAETLLDLAKMLVTEQAIVSPTQPR